MTTKRGTWLGRPGTSTDYHISGRGRSELRVEEFQWADEDTVTVRLIWGDGRYTDFTEYLSVGGVEPGQGRALWESLSGTQG